MGQDLVSGRVWFYLKAKSQNCSNRVSSEGHVRVGRDLTVTMGLYKPCRAPTGLLQGWKDQLQKPSM